MADCAWQDRDRQNEWRREAETAKVMGGEDRMSGNENAQLRIEDRVRLCVCHLKVMGGVCLGGEDVFHLRVEVPQIVPHHQRRGHHTPDAGRGTVKIIQ